MLAAMAVAVAAAFLLIQQLQLITGAAALPCFPAVFVFGDSLSDTGNGVLSGNVRTAQPPYGETVPGSPARRFSDGLLLVDFLATRVGLPLLNPSLDETASFATGANYAVAGATADSAAKYATTKFIAPVTPYSLDVGILR
ncbi:hypothetical protein GOP47_0009819 [Adiantum capillus-veneris]|uniref:GDSL esterase/lipase n=1 Tax=Adiantum capillus-veneris TaxID=13818 RepID=A0A9D4ZHH9_ADICA|nr:hypothetical protein GOP47_0009819 [Adiantum capillus-veneris]